MMARTYGILPSDIIDPDRIHIAGLERYMFDLELTARISERVAESNQGSVKDQIMNERRKWQTRT